MAKKKKKQAPAPIRFAGSNSVKSIERSYEKLLLRYHKAYKAAVMGELKMVLPSLQKEAVKDNPERLDANFDSVLKSAFGRAGKKLAEAYSAKTLRKWAAMITARVDKSTKKDIETMVGQAKKMKKKNIELGGGEFKAEIVMPETVIKRQLNPFYQNVIDQQIGLIESIPEEESAKMRKILTKSLIDNEPIKTIEKRLTKAFKVSEGRARLIARDQVLKLNGAVNRVKQQAIGVTKYKWRTVRDDRVRGRHQDLEGRVFSWDDPPRINLQGDRGHPGDDYQCRCYAEAVLDDI